jgi:hypothetical protein
VASALTAAVATTDPPTAPATTSPSLLADAQAPMAASTTTRPAPAPSIVPPNRKRPAAGRADAGKDPLDGQY